MKIKFYLLASFLLMFSCQKENVEGLELDVIIDIY